MTLTEYSEDQLAAQPIGYWTGAANEIIASSLRAALAEEDLTQPHWWILTHVDESAEWTRAALTAKLAPFDTQNLDFEAIYDDLAGRGWTTEADAVLALTESGQAGFKRARERNFAVHARMHDGIDTARFVAALNVLRQMIDNLGGNSDLP